MMRKPKRDGWFRPRTYAHFDYPLTFDQAVKLVADVDVVSKRAFLPLVGYTDKRRTFRTDNSKSAVPRSKRPKKVGEKLRDIKYASHADSAILSHYASQLQAKYEEWLIKSGLDKGVIGYRSGLGSNVDLAAQVFSEVVIRRSVTCLCFDISDFFPSIDHIALKRGLNRVLDVQALPKNWYNIYRNITKFSWVDLKEISGVLAFDPKQPPSPLVSDLPAAMRVLRQSRLIHINSVSKGIPQGTPISAVLANVAMAEFDLIMLSWAEARGGTYRRYSDDILLMVPSSHEALGITFTIDLAAQAGLIINGSKTEISRFDDSPGVLTTDNPLTYLDFSFDGSRTYLRARTLSRYYRRMTYAVRGSIRGAGRQGKPASDAYRRTLYRELTHLGKVNFYRYAARADAKLPASIIKRQLRRHFRILLRKLNNVGR